MEEVNHYYVLLLAGGGGTRLWPKSRKTYPKHLLRIYGERTMLQQSYDRIEKIFPPENIFLVTLETYVLAVKKQLPQLLEKNIIIEPLSKNTALAMSLGAMVIQKKDPQAVIINLPADHLVEDVKKFQDVVMGALEVAAKDDQIVAVAIKPSFAHTGLGYIKIGDEIEEYRNSKRNLFVFLGRGFREKPDLATAQSFLASGQYLWNGGMYCWKAQTLIQAIKIYDPSLFRIVSQINQGLGSNKEQVVLKEAYAKAENVSIDYAVSEKAKNLVVIPGDFGWSDVGDWKVIYDTQEKDRDGNVVVSGNDSFLGINTKDSLIETNGKLVVAIGLKDVVIVETPDALLVCQKDQTQDVKKAVEQLKVSAHSKVL